jgi:hypothetical protein
VAVAMVASWGNDNYFCMLGEGSVKKLKPVICELCELLTKTVEEEEATILALPPPVRKAYQRLITGAMCIAGLIDPMPGYCGSSPADVTLITTYKGSEIFESTLKILVTHKNAPFWGSQYDEFLKTATTATLSAPFLKRHLSALALMPGSHDGPSPEAIKAAIKDLPDLRQGLRQGATAQMETLLLTALVNSGRLMMLQADLSQGSDSVNMVMNGLGLFMNKDGVLDLCRELTAWRGKMSANMSAHDFGNYMKDAINSQTASKQQYNTNNKNDKYNINNKNNINIDVAQQP